MADTPKTTLTKNASTEIGRSGTIIYKGLITQEEYNRNLTGILGNQTYEIMRRSDSTIHSALQIVKLPIRSTTWDIDPAENDGVITEEDKFKARFVKRELMQRAINFDDFIKQLLTGFDFGFSVHEKIYGLVEFEGRTMIGLEKLASRKQITIYRWTMEDGQPGITQMVNGTKYEIPRSKLVIFTYDKEGENDEGTSLLRYIYKDWNIKDKLTIVNAMALEKLGVGVPKVTAKDNQTPTPSDINDAIDSLRNIRANNQSYLSVPSTMDVEFMDLRGNTTKDVIPTLNYHDGRIMTGVLARFMEIGGASGTGSNSLAKELSSIFFKAEEAIAREIVTTITESIIKQICDLNFADMSTGYPKLTFGAIADDDNSAVATAVANLMNAGAITPDADVEDNLRVRFRLPEMSKQMRDNYSAVLKDKETDVTSKNGGESNISDAEKKKSNIKDEADIEAAVHAAREARKKLVTTLTED